MPHLAPPRTRRHWLSAALSLTALPFAACGGAASTPPATAATRTWRMGFSPNPPAPTVAAVLQGIDTFSPRAELCIVHEELPWTDLLAGMSPDAILDRDKVALVDHIRGKGLELVFMGDLTDGLDRSAEAGRLRALGRSIREPAVQALYRDYLLAVDRRLKPLYLGLAAETNLIRLAAPALYPAVRATANDTAAALRQAGSSTPLMASVQVDVAWGRLQGSTTAYTGVETDFADFPFMQALGLSSYPYFGWADPDALPLDYYARLLGGRSLPALVVEGGWASVSGNGISTSPDHQLRYVNRQAQLLDAVQARAWLQLVFADIDLSTWPQPVPANLPLFTSIGFTDSQFRPKPALAAWDALHGRRWVG
jgi:hypothetical protein